MLSTVPCRRCQPRTPGGGGTGGSSTAARALRAGARQPREPATGGDPDRPLRPAATIIRARAVTSVDWHGCVWTGIDAPYPVAHEHQPKDFMASRTGVPIGVAAPSKHYDAVAMIGFNLNEAITGDANQCKNNQRRDRTARPRFPRRSHPYGIAVTGALPRHRPTSFRIRSSVDGSTNGRPVGARPSLTRLDLSREVDRLYTHVVCRVSGKTRARSQPGHGHDRRRGLLVPGTVARWHPRLHHRSALRPATTRAPLQAELPLRTTTGIWALDSFRKMPRCSVEGRGTDCKQYIIQNNNWGNPTGSTQSSTSRAIASRPRAASGSGSSAPASSRRSTSAAWPRLPRTYRPGRTAACEAISAIGSITRPSRGPGTSNGDYNAAYGRLVARTSPTAGSYNDAIRDPHVWLTSG